MYPGTLFIISAPSGAGKSSLINSVLKEKFLNKVFLSISYTTRFMRAGEKNGYDYFFVSKKKFKEMKKNGFFLESEKVFNNYYGTPINNINKMLLLGLDVLLNINYKGAKKICELFLNVIKIVILPPSKNVLYKRLINRKTDSKINIKERMKVSVAEISYYKSYDYLIINDDFEKAKMSLYSIIFSKRLTLKYQKRKINHLLKH